MKRGTISICLSLIMTTAFSQQYKLISLNGYSQSDAISMIKNFKNINSTPTTTQLMVNVWLRKEILQDIITLLSDETTSRKNENLPVPDGIRIYFAADINTNKPTIVIVTTYDTRVIDPTTGKDYHEDYYEHLAGEPLFNTTLPIKGEPHYDNSNGSAVLYVPCANCQDDPTCPKGPHYLTRKQCEQMVEGFGMDAVNSTAEFFDVGLLKAFASEITRNKYFDGIRIYFGRHPFNDNSPYPNKDAFVIVTTQTIDGQTLPNEDYFDCGTTNDYFTNQTQLHNVSMKTNGQDNGELCPDNCNVP